MNFRLCIIRWRFSHGLLLVVKYSAVLLILAMILIRIFAADGAHQNGVHLAVEQASFDAASVAVLRKRCADAVFIEFLSSA